MLTLETRDRVRIVTLARPEARNAVNPALARMLGRPRESLVGQPFTVAAVDAERDRADRVLAALLANSPRVAREWPLRRADFSSVS